MEPSLALNRLTELALENPPPPPPPAVGPWPASELWMDPRLAISGNKNKLKWVQSLLKNSMACSMGLKEASSASGCRLGTDPWSAAAECRSSS